MEKYDGNFLFDFVTLLWCLAIMAVLIAVPIKIILWIIGL